MHPAACALLALSALAAAAPDCIEVHGKPHRKEVLARGLNRPYQLAAADRTRQLFFSFNVGSDAEDTFRVGRLDENATQPAVLDAVTNGFAVLVDNRRHRAYLGGSDGVYRYPLAPNATGEKIVHEHNIWGLFLGEHLYFINYPEQRLYRYELKDNSSQVELEKRIHEDIFHFAIDEDGDTFITNATGAYLIEKGSSERKILNGRKFQRVFRAVAADRRGAVHFVGKHGIFVVDKKTCALVEVAHVKNIFGLTFDRDNNIIYSDPHEIVKLVPDKCKVKE